METAARVVIGAFAAIVLVHYLNGGRAQAARYLKYVFSGRVDNVTSWQPTGRQGVGVAANGSTYQVPTIRRRERLADGTVVETTIGAV